MHMDMKIQLVKEILEEHFSYVKITGLCATSPGFCCDYGRKDNALKLIKMVSCFNAESIPNYLFQFQVAIWSPDNWIFFGWNPVGTFRNIPLYH